ITEVVFTELPSRVAEVLEELRDRRVFEAETQLCTRQPDLGQAGADRRLPGDEGGAASGATLLAVEVGEHRARLRDAVDVGRAVAHNSVVLATDVEPADVVSHDKKDARLVRLGHIQSPFTGLQTSQAVCASSTRASGEAKEHGEKGEQADNGEQY